MSSPMPTLYDFLTEAELPHYLASFRNDLKVNSVQQLKYVEEDDLLQLGMTKPEMRRLRKYFQKYCPQTYLRKIKKMIHFKNRDDPDRSSFYLNDKSLEKNNVKVPSKHIIPKDSIVINKELGSGEFGTVQQGVWTNEEGERIQVAIKCLCEERIQNNHMEFLKEAAITHSIDHEHIVRLYGVVLESHLLMMVTELAPLRSLLECLKEPALRHSFPVTSLCDFAVQICDGMEYLEIKKLIHRDLAARNVLVYAKNKVKISDFGLSRALGVGKDYYQTNFNVNLKLPIAWCAPECINYLRFTCASDVWAYGVTMWEMFSYGFQPWAGLTGKQILDAIDEPNFQRLEQPECCPKEYYALMVKCWQHDANKRPLFSEISTMLPECKPEQVQAVQESIDLVQNSKKEWLQYKTGEIITVLDKRPLPDSLNVWKGVLSSGKTGLFNPAQTVSYLTNFPSTRPPSFARSDSKAGLYASKRRLRTDMISQPQGDFKHTGHVGLDGAFFGDISFLGDKYNQLPRQIVNPYKPQNDKDMSPSSISNGSDQISSLKKSYIYDGSSSDNSCELNNSDSKYFIKSEKKEELHLIEDDDDDFGSFMDSAKFDSLDLGPSLMDEIFKTLSSPPDLNFDLKEDSFCAAFAEEEAKISAKPDPDTPKKKQAMVKPISVVDQSPVEITRELSNHSLDENRNVPNGDSPRAQTSPFKKLSFKLKSSPKFDRRNFSEETEAIQNIENSITNEAREAYDSLVEQGDVGHSHNVTSPPTVAPKPKLNTEIKPNPQPMNQTTDLSDPDAEAVESNPLRLLRSGVAMKPKIRGNKHGSFNGSRTSIPQTSTVSRIASNTMQTRSSLGAPPPPPSNHLQSATSEPERENFNDDTSSSSSAGDCNPIPLPPRDRPRVPMSIKLSTHRYPPVFQDSIEKTDCISAPANDFADFSPNGGQQSPNSQVLALSRGASESESALSDSLTNVTSVSQDETGVTPPPKPARTFMLNDSMSSVDSETHQESQSSTQSVNSDLQQRVQHSSPDINSDEVRIMRKVLAKEMVTAEQCVFALSETDGDIHDAIKLLRLQCLLSSRKVPDSALKPALLNCGWNVRAASNQLIATYHND